MFFNPMTCADWGACMSMVCLNLSLSADRELNADFNVVWTAEKQLQETERKSCHGNYITI